MTEERCVITLHTRESECEKNGEAGKGKEGHGSGRRRRRNGEKERVKRGLFEKRKWKKWNGRCWQNRMMKKTYGCLNKKSYGNVIDLSFQFKTHFSNHQKHIK